MRSQSVLVLLLNPLIVCEARHTARWSTLSYLTNYRLTRRSFNPPRKLFGFNLDIDRPILASLPTDGRELFDLNVSPISSPKELDEQKNRFFQSASNHNEPRLSLSEEEGQPSVVSFRLDSSALNQNSPTDIHITSSTPSHAASTSAPDLSAWQDSHKQKFGETSSSMEIGAKKTRLRLVYTGEGARGAHTQVDQELGSTERLCSGSRGTANGPDSSSHTPPSQKNPGSLQLADSRPSSIVWPTLPENLQDGGSARDSRRSESNRHTQKDDSTEHLKLKDGTSSLQTTPRSWSEVIGNFYKPAQANGQPAKALGSDGVNMPPEFSPTLSQLAILLSLDLLGESKLSRELKIPELKRFTSCFMYSILLKGLSSYQVKAIGLLYSGFMVRFHISYQLELLDSTLRDRQYPSLSAGLIWISEMLNNAVDKRFFEKLDTKITTKPVSSGRPKDSLKISPSTKLITYLAFEHRASSVNRAERIRSSLHGWLDEAWRHDVENGILALPGGGLKGVVESRAPELWEATSLSIYRSAARIDPLIARLYRIATAQSWVWTNFLRVLLRKKTPHYEIVPETLLKFYDKNLPSSDAQLEYYRQHLPKFDSVAIASQEESEEALYSLSRYFPVEYDLFEDAGLTVDKVKEFYTPQREHRNNSVTRTRVRRRKKDIENPGDSLPEDDNYTKKKRRLDYSQSDHE